MLRVLRVERVLVRLVLPELPVQRQRSAQLVTQGVAVSPAQLAGTGQLAQ